MPRYERNASLNGIELYFDSIPDVSIRQEIKELGFRWNGTNRFWYAKETEERLALVQRLCGEASNSKTVTLKSAKKQATSHVSAPIMNKRCCYSNSVRGFLAEDENAWLKTMKAAFSDEYILELGNSQLNAWVDCFRCLKVYLPLLEEEHKNFSIIFEYALPYESGRRPDVILLSKDQVIILEFKMKNAFLPEDIDQAAAYARDIREYHFESREKKVTSILVLTKTKDVEPYELKGSIACSVDCLPEAIEQQIEGDVLEINIEKWMDSRYEPLPTIVDAARMLMKHEKLPIIRRVNSTGIPDAIKFLTDITLDAQKYKKHVLAMVTGVPGAGKTFLGLQYVYDICESNDNVNSVYLSGNGPLIKVLTDALSSNVFVKSIHTVVNEYLAGKARDFKKNVIVFDEGQRAWDKNQMLSKRGTEHSEPDVLVDLAEEKLDWCVLLTLVGEGQEINTGENSGLAQWNTAISRSGHKWDIVCPQKLVPVFKNSKNVISNDNLNLNTTLRSYLASDVSKFVNLLIDGNIKDASELAPSILDAGFNMYVTQDLDAAKEYCIRRYAGSETKRYGLMASSKAYSLSKYRMKPVYQPDVAALFNKKPSEAGSCCELKITISEFDCQGLEIDMPIVGWGNDMLWDGRGWKKFKSDESVDSEANTYRINSYRVLLTRGRDGFIAFIPKTAELQPVYDALVEAGVVVL